MILPQLEPALRLGQVTVKFPASFLVSKRQGLLSKRSGMSLRYYGDVGLLDCRPGVFEYSENVSKDLFQAMVGFVALGIFTPDAGSALTNGFLSAVRIHEIAFHLDFPSKWYLYLKGEDFRFSQETGVVNSTDYSKKIRVRVRHGTAFEEQKSKQDSFLAYWPLFPQLPDGTRRLQLKLSGPCAQHVPLDCLDRDAIGVFRTLLPNLAIRLSQVASPETFQPNFALAPFMSPDFLELLRRAGWYSAGPHIARRHRSAK
jgi:hypothetical protein